MDKPKTKVVKSKSSNSAITTKSEPRKHNKKTRSNAEFQPLALKKRGVYVEKKISTKISMNEKDISPVDLPKQPSYHRPIPRPGRKRFLASVLTILSQSTAGTQYPDHDDPDRLKKIDRKTKFKKRKREEIIHEDTNSLPFNINKKKRTYKSKVLNHMNNDTEQLVVLRSKKEIAQTPSNYSEKSNNDKNKGPETIKWADILPPLVKNDIESGEHNKNTQDNNKEKGIKLVEKDPSTLVAEIPKKDEKKLYNFFVDLLETTFNVYNVKTEFNPPIPESSVTSSKIALEMDESVANKLNIQKVKESPEISDDTCSQRQSYKQYYCIKPDDNGAWDDQQLLEHFQPKYSKRSRPVSPSKSLKRKRRLQSESFDYKKTKPIPVANSFNVPYNKKTPQKDRKKHFINLLKEQLKMEDDAFIEPQNFFQALKVIAKNKRRCQKSIHFNESTKKLSEGDVHVCQFKRRRLLSASTKSSGKKSSYHPESHIIRSMRSFTRNSDITSSTFNKVKSITINETPENEIEPSQHSLEVYGFDYETNTHKKGSNQETDRMLAFDSVVSMTGKDYNMNEALLNYSDSGSSSIMIGNRKHVAGKHGLGSLRKVFGVQ